MNVLGRVWRAVSPLPTQRRRVWTSANRVHAEIRGLSHPDPAVRARVAGAVVAVVGAVDGVDAVTVTPATGRMIACVTDTGAMLAVLEDVMRQAEMRAGSERFGFGDRVEHPGDSGLVRREVVTLAADAAGFALAVAGRAARLARVPVEVASVVPLVQAHARLRRP